MPQHLARTARSSSRSSKRADPTTSSGLGPSETTLLAVARVTGAHGVRGALRVRPFHETTDALGAGREVTLRVAGRDTTATIARVAPHGRGHLLVELDGLGDRTAAERLRGADLLVPVASLPPLGPGEFYYHEMPGYSVETADGTVVGEIADTLHTGTTDVWVVRAGAREHLIPVVREVVATIDRAGRRVVITPIPGLLD